MQRQRGFDIGGAKADDLRQIANTRGPDSLAALATELGTSVKPVEISAALKADVVILAVPFDAVRDVLSKGTAWSGRILVDASNAIDPKTFGPADLGGRPSSTLVSEWAPGAEVVKGFNHFLARILKREPDDGRGYGKRTLFISGASETAKKTVSDLMTQMGFAVIDLGSLSEGGLLQQYGGRLMGRSLVTQEMSGSTYADMDVQEH